MQKILLQVVAVVIFFISTCQNATSQLQLPLPSKFQSLSINSRALEKDFDFTLDNESSKITQNFLLDKTGVILHLKPFPSIMDDKIRLRVFSSDGIEIATFTFIDSSIFSLIDPEQTYFIVQEIKPQCSQLIKPLNLDSSDTLCPDLIAIKTYDKIMIAQDTSFRINLRALSEFYALPLQIPEGTKFLDKDFNILGVENTSSNESHDIQSHNLAELLTLGKICIVSSSKPKSEKAKINNLSCSFTNSNIHTIVTFLPNNESIPSSPVFKLAFPFQANIFDNLSHEYIFECSKSLSSQNDPIEITKKSLQQLFLDNYNFSLNLNLGQILKSKTKIRKNSYILNNPIQIDKELKLTIFQILLDQLDTVINPFKEASKESVLTNFQIQGKEKKSTGQFNILLDNNLIVKDLSDPISDTNIKQKNNFQTTSTNNLNISALLPLINSDYKIDFNRTYTSVEQTTAPSVTEAGKAIKIVNNKSKNELIFSDSYPDISPASDTNTIQLEIEKASDNILDSKFKDQLSLSGFILPPDSRPVLEENYRANIKVSMTLKLKGGTLLTINYSDLKTKDETPLINFFSFLFLPSGEYKVKLKFGADRKKFFEKAGIIKPNN